MVKIRLLIGLLVISLAILLSTKTAVDYLFVNRISSSSFFYNECEKVWGHRGYLASNDGNSLSSFKEAFKLGAKGTELDIFYDVEMNDFVVSHDFPYVLEGGTLLMLDDVFSAFGNRYYYWLDFKNLEDLSGDDVRKSVLEMERKADEYGIREKIIIESKNISNISRFAKAGFNTSYWITFNEKLGRWNFWKNLYDIKINYILGHFSAASLHYSNYTPKIQDSFSGLPVLLFTVNEKSKVEQYIEDDSVKVIVSDGNYYNVANSACRQK